MIEVSIVVTTKNEEKNIGNCLESIKKQDFPKDKLEVIVVDNDSSDKTREIAAGYNCRIYMQGPERSAQRNFAALNSSAEFIIFLDADMIASERLISECVSKCRGEGLTALYIPERIIGKGFWIKVRDFERSFYNATVIDCVRFVRKDDFLAIEGFDRKLTGPEDWDFDRRIKLRGNTGITVSPVYHNEDSFDFRRYISKKMYYAASFSGYIAKWGKNDPVVKKQLGFSYRYIFVFLENGKWKKLLSHPLLALGMYFLRLILGCVFVFKRSAQK